MKDYLTEIADLKARIAHLERELAEARLAIKNLTSLPNRKPSNMHFATCDDEACPGCFW